jgi:peptidoglycan/LPS O-acetylase OafA/YrhL
MGRRLPALDGLRACAALMVVVAHSIDPHAQILPGVTVAGWLGESGVRLFFVLSGLLITSILLRARVDAETTGVSRVTVWRAFVIRRTLRIVPLAYVAILVVLVIGAPLAGAHWWPTLYRVPRWAYFLYVQNLPRFVPFARYDALGHFWSLAVEEHFYLVWPVLLLFLPRRALLPAMVPILVVVGPLSRVWLADAGPSVAYENSLCRADALAFGGLLALLEPGTSTVWRGSLWLWAVVLIVPSLPISESASIVLAGAIVLAIMRGAAASFFALKPLVYLGRISYGIYVWHVIIPDLLVRAGYAIPAFGLTRLIVTGAGTIALATLTWYGFERRLTDLSRFFPYVSARSGRAVEAACAVAV